MGAQEAYNLLQQFKAENAAKAANQSGGNIASNTGGTSAPSPNRTDAEVLAAKIEGRKATDAYTKRKAAVESQKNAYSHVWNDRYYKQALDENEAAKEAEEIKPWSGTASHVWSDYYYKQALDAAEKEVSKEGKSPSVKWLDYYAKQENESPSYQRVDDVQAVMDRYSEAYDDYYKALSQIEVVKKNNPGESLAFIPKMEAEAEVKSNLVKEYARQLKEFGVDVNGANIYSDEFLGKHFADATIQAKAANQLKPIDAVSLLVGDAPIEPGSLGKNISKLTDDEKLTLKYLREEDKKNGTSIAKIYENYLANEINKREGAAKAEQIMHRENDILKVAGYGTQALKGGLDTALTDISQSLGGNRIDSTSKHASDILGQDVNENGSYLARIGFAAAQSTGAMLPGLATSVVNPAFGAMVFGTTSGMSAYQEKLDEGWNPNDAAAYGALTGASEAGLQYLLGGIGILGDTPAYTAIKASMPKISNALVRASANATVRAALEGLEEGLQTYISPAIVSVVKDIPYDAPEFEDAVFNAVVGAATSVALGGSSFINDMNVAKEEAAKAKAEQEAIVARQNEIVKARNAQNDAQVSTLSERADLVRGAREGAQSNLESFSQRRMNSFEGKNAISVPKKIASEIANTLETRYGKLDPEGRPSLDAVNVDGHRYVVRNNLDGSFDVIGKHKIKTTEAEEVRNIIDQMAGIAPVAEEATESSIKAQETSGEQVTPEVTQEAEQAASERLNQQSVSTTQNNNVMMEKNQSLQRAIELSVSGASPSRIYSETGYMRLGNGDLVDEKTREVVWKANDGQTERVESDIDTSKSRGKTEPEIRGDDRRGNQSVRGRNDRLGRESALSGSGRNYAYGKVIPLIDSSVNKELDKFVEVYGSKEAFADDVIDSFVKGDVLFEEWTPVLGKDNAAAIKEALNSIVSEHSASNRDIPLQSPPDRHKSTDSAELTETLKAESDAKYAAEQAAVKAEQTEASSANKASDVGKGQMDFDGVSIEEKRAQVKKDNFGTHIETATKVAGNISKIIEDATKAVDVPKGTKVSARAEALAADAAEGKGLRELSNAITSLASGETTVSQFLKSYEYFELDSDGTKHRYYFPEVVDKLKSAKGYLEGTKPNAKLGTLRATEALQLLDKRIEQRIKYDDMIYSFSENMPETVKKMKNTGIFKHMLETGDGKSGRNYRLTLDLITPNTFFKMLDGFDAAKKGLGYQIAESERNSNLKEKATFTEANNFFEDVLARNDAKDLLSGKMQTHVMFNGTRKLSVTELVHLVRGLESILATRGEDGLNTMKGIGLVRDGKPEILEFKNKDKRPVIEQLKSLRANLDVALEENSAAKAYNDALTKMLEYMHPKLNEAQIARDGYEIGYVADGKYFPVRYTSENPSNRGYDEDNFFDGLGITKERTKMGGGVIKVEAGMDAINQYMQNASRYVGWAEHSQMIQMLAQSTANNESLGDVISSNLGVGAAEHFKKYADDLKFQSTDKDPTGVMAGVAWLRRNLAQAAITLKVTTPVKQAAGTLAAAGDIKLGNLLAVQFGAGKQYADTDNIYLQHRGLSGVDRTLGDLNKLDDTWWKKCVSKIKVGDFKAGEWALKAVSRADKKAILNIYKAAALQVSRENGGIDIRNNPELMKQADDLFVDALLGTQADTTKISNAALYRSDNELAKNIVLFKSQQNAQLNATITSLLEAQAAKGTKNESKANAKARAVVAGQLASSLEFAALGTLVNAALHKFKDFTDEDDEFDETELLLNLGDSFLETLSGIYLFGDSLYSALKVGSSFVTKRDSTLYNPSAGGINTVIDMVSKINNLTQNPSPKNIKDLSVVIGNAFGVPFGGVYDVVNAAVLWTRDVSRAVQGKSADPFRYSDSLNLAKDAIEWSKATEEQKRLYEALGVKNVYAGKNKKNAPSTIEYDESEYDLTNSERRQYQKLSLDTSQDIIEELVNSALYAEASDKNKAAMIKDAVAYGKDAAKKQFLESKGVEYESDWDDERVLKDLPGYLAFKTASKAAYGDKDDTPDYDTIDALIKSSYGDLSDEAKALIDKNSRFAKMDDLYAASKLGIDSETWYTDYKATYDELAEKVDQSIAEAKAIEEKTGEDVKAKYGWSEAATEFAHYVEAHAETPKQAELLRSQFTYWQQIPGSTESYDNYRTAGISIDSSLHLVSKLGELKPLDGNKTVVQRQKQEAVAFDEILTDEEKYIALLEVTNSNSTKKLSNIQYAQSKGMSPEECFRLYLAD